MFFSRLLDRLRSRLYRCGVLYPTCYPIPLHFVGNHGARLCEVVEIDGVPHAVTETRAGSFSAVRLDPSKIRDLRKEGDSDRVRCFYLAAVALDQAVEIPGSVMSKSIAEQELEPQDGRRKASWFAAAWIPLRVADASSALSEAAVYTGV